MTVPEAAMHPDQRAIFGEDQIGSARKITAMKPEPEAARMQALADDQLRLRVPPPDCSHVAAPGGGVMDISQLCAGPAFQLVPEYAAASSGRPR